MYKYTYYKSLMGPLLQISRSVIQISVKDKGWLAYSRTSPLHLEYLPDCQEQSKAISRAHHDVLFILPTLQLAGILPAGKMFYDF